MKPGIKGERAWRGGGFVLPELMAVLALLMVLAVLAVPSFQHWLWRDRVDQAARNLLGTFSFARNEAQRIGRKVSVCRANGAAECAKTSMRCGQGAQARADNWACGWLVTVEAGGADATPRLRVLRVYPASAGLQIISPAAALPFTPPAGQVIGSFRNFDIALATTQRSASQASWQRCIRLAAGGRPRLSDGACGASS